MGTMGEIVGGGMGVEDKDFPIRRTLYIIVQCT